MRLFKEEQIIYFEKYYALYYLLKSIFDVIEENFVSISIAFLYILLPAAGLLILVMVKIL